MILNTDKVTELCTKYNISPTEFYLLFTIATKDWINLEKYISKRGVFSMKTLNRLRSIGILMFLDFEGTQGEPLINPENVNIDRRFLNDVMVDIDEAYDRLVDAYPWQFTSKGEDFNARTGTPRDNVAMLLKHTKGDPATIEEIIDLTNYAREHGLITMGLEKYIERRYWLFVKLKRAEGVGGFLDMA